MTVRPHLQIDLRGLEDKWSRRRKVCAVCGKDFDEDHDEDHDEDEDWEVPLLLFRGQGKETEMLTLCFEPCAGNRMPRKHSTP